MAKFPILYNEDDTETQLPHKWEICGYCNGHGKTSRHVENDGGGITASEMEEAGPEFMKDYLAGFYDRDCDNCGGSGKVAVADLSRMTKAQRKAWKEQCEEFREMEAIEAAERRMGA